MQECGYRTLRTDGQCRVLTGQWLHNSAAPTLVTSEKRPPQLEDAACFIMYLTLFLHHGYLA